jgi:hypothetical protein
MDLIETSRIRWVDINDRTTVDTSWRDKSLSRPQVQFGEPIKCFNPVGVAMRAEALSRKAGLVGTVAFSRTGDPVTGNFGDAKVIRKFGDVPDDLSAL